jgi:hypothetical protein
MKKLDSRSLLNTCRDRLRGNDEFGHVISYETFGYAVIKSPSFIYWPAEETELFI